MDKDLSTEQKILGAAKKVFIRKGFAAARMQEIADEAGINKALLHYYFRSKDKLFEKIFEVAFAMIFPRLVDLLKNDIPIKEKITLFYRNYVDMLKDNPYLPVFILNEINQNPERLSFYFSKYINSNNIQILQNQINQEVESGIINYISAKQLIVNIISLAIFPFAGKPLLMLQLKMDEQEFDEFIEQRKRIIPEMLWKGIKA